MAIFIISRRPLAPHNERAWHYRTRMTSDNAAVNAEFNRERAYAKLRKVVEEMAHSWRVAEPDTQFRVVDTGLGKPDTMPAEFIAPVEADDDVRKMQVAWAAGVAAAKDLKPGDEFLGATPTAKAWGYVGGIEESAFVSGYLSALPRPIVCNNRDDNRIVSLGAAS